MSPSLLSPGSYQSDICRAEQLRALRKGKRVIPILAKPGTDIPLHLETKNYRRADQLELLLRDIQTGKNAVVLRQEFQQTYVTAPPLPRNYLPRPDALGAIRNALLTEDPGPSIALTALKGMGGIGKTVLAQALCHDEVVQEAFPDGIIWITAGKESTIDLVTRLREVGKGLNDDLTGYDTQLGSINRYRNILREKAALIVVDDVWDPRDIEPFRAESPRSRLLFTTRDGGIAGAVGAEQVIAGLLTPEQSRLLLAQWAKLKPEDLPPEAADVIRESGRLPLALAMLGAMLREKPRAYWTHVLNLLRNADLARIRTQFPDYPHTDLLRAIQVSVEALDERARTRYLALAVLLEDMPVHPAIQQVLWNADEFDCLETAEQFVSLSLAQRDQETGGIRLHDLQLDYIRAQHSDRGSLELIHGAVRLSSHVIAKDLSQFVSQLIGRLLPYEDEPAIRRFTSSLAQAARKPWLRALQPGLHPPGTALVRTLEGHSHWVRGVAVTRDGHSVTASDDKTLKVWDLETGRELRTLEGHSSKVNGVAATRDGRRAISASNDKTLKVWDLETGRELRTLQGHSGSVLGVAVSPDGRHAVSASDDLTLRVWDLETGRNLRTLEGHSGWILAVAVSPDGRRAVSASSDNTFKVWHLEDGRELPMLEGHTNWVTAVAASPDGRRTVSASRDKTLKVWDLQTGRELRSLEGHSDWVRGVAVSPDGRCAVSASDDKWLKVWDLETGRELRTLEGHSGVIYGVAVSPDGRRAVSASGDQTVMVWDLETGRNLRSLKGHSRAVNSVAVSPDGQRAVSASYDKTLRVWDLETGRNLRTLRGHSGGVHVVALSPDGRRALSAAHDKTLKVWDLETGCEVRTLKGHSGPVNCAAVSPDGWRAVSASWDGTVKVWNLETGEVLATFSADAAMFCCAFGTNRIIAAGDRVGHLHFLALEE